MKYTVFFCANLLISLLYLCGTDAYAQIPELDYAPKVRTLLSYNIRNAMNDDGNMDYADVVSTIQGCNADVVAIQELDSVTHRSNGRDVLKELALLSQYYPIYGASISYGGGKYGVGILSRKRPISVRQLALPGREEKRTMLVAEFDDFVLGCTHLSLTEEDRLASVDMIVAEAANFNKPFFLAGDLNDTIGSKFMKHLEESFDLISSDKPTFPAHKPRTCIDHIASYTSSTAGAVVVREAKVLDRGRVSDHRATMIRWQMKTPKEKILYGEPYLQNVSHDGATVMFQSQTRVHAWVEYGTDTLLLKKAQMLYGGQAVCHEVEHRVRLDGVEPGRRCYYRVCAREILHYEAYNKVLGDTVKTDFYSFVLPEKDTKDFTAIVLNDLHTDGGTIACMAELAKTIPHDFVVFNGDCMPDPHSRMITLKMLHRLASSFNASEIPCIFIRGNHEIRNAYSSGLPSLLEYAAGNTYGTFDWGDTRFVVLDCGEDKPDDTPVYYGLNDFSAFRQEQYDFLKREINSDAFRKAKRRVLINHIPLWGNGDKYQPCSELWGKLLAKADFDVNLSGHTHRFRFHPKGAVSNPFPLCIGGGPNMKGATMMVLSKMGEKMNLRVLNTSGEEVGSWDL
jgi:endonuclease/exonuclease/phosphatase family metal-dependent hydrolase